ncbi:MAG: hypothetical protein KGV44_00865 [Flavobacteriaceae bacterium]|nr:hypothetical protein [Flavobacteriaceae bacterium]
MYTKEFKDFIEQGNKKKQYIGIGNPNAKILIIGKEPNLPLDKQESNAKENAKKWQKEFIDNNKQDTYCYPIDEKHELRKNWHTRTWNKYQILKTYIYNENYKPHYVDFLKGIFTTEMNNTPAKTTHIAQNTEGFQNKLSDRKKIFHDSKFIQQFPVVVLACSNYIKNNDKIREIDGIFEVEYIGDKNGKKFYNKNNWFYIHHNTDRTKLVIHTRQLSGNVKDEMLKAMGETIREHLQRNNIL